MRARLLCALLLLPLVASLAGFGKPPTKPAAGRKGGAKTAVKMRAQAPPVLLIHGMHCTGEHWAGWRARLSQAGLEVHAPTLRHHDGYFSNVPGASQPPSALGRTSIEDYASDLAQYAATLREPPVLIGHSMGGLLAMKLLERGVGQGALLIATAGIGQMWAPYPSQALLFMRFTMGWPLQRPIRMRPFHSNFGLFNELPKGSAERETAEKLLVYESGYAYAESMWSPLSFVLNGGKRSTALVDTTKITQPVAVWGGDRDRATPARVHRRVAQRVPGATYRLYRGRGHWLVSENGWEGIADDAIEWVQRNFGADDGACADEKI